MFDALKAGSREPLAEGEELSRAAIQSALDVVGRVDAALDLRDSLVKDAAIDDRKYHMLLVATVSAEDTREPQSNFVFCQLGSSKPKADEVVSSPDSDYNVASRTLKYLQTNLTKSLLKKEYPTPDNTLNYLLFPELSQSDRLSAHMVGFLTPEQEDYAFNIKTLDYLAAVRSAKGPVVAGEARPQAKPDAKREVLAEESPKAKAEIDTENPFKFEGSQVQPKSESKAKDAGKTPERRASGAGADKGGRTQPKSESKATDAGKTPERTERRESGADKAVHFQRDSAPMMRELHKEKYDDDDSIYDKIPLLQGMRQPKKPQKKPLVHNKFNDAAQKAPGSCLDFWTHDVDFHNHGDIELAKRLEAASRRVTTMAKRVIQTDCCKKMEAFINNGFSPTFFDRQGYSAKSGGKAAGREERVEGHNDSRSLNDMLDLI